MSALLTFAVAIIIAWAVAFIVGLATGRLAFAVRCGWTALFVVLVVAYLI